MRCTLIAALAVISVFWGWPLDTVVTTANAASPHQVDPSGQFKATGLLRKEGVLKNGTPRYALYEEGRLTTHIVPPSGLDISPYIEQRVEVTARAVSYRGDSAPYVLADKVGPAALVPPATLPASVTSPSSRTSTAAHNATAPHGVAVASYESHAIDEHPVAGPSGRGYPQPLGPRPGVAVPQGAHSGAVQLAAGEEYLDVPPAIPYADPDPSLYGTGSPDLMAHSPAACPTCGSCGAGHACGPQGCDPNAPCGLDGYTWIRADYLYWWTKGLELPPLVTTGVDQTAAQAGVLAQPGTTILLGEQTVLNENRNGGRFKAGYWRDQQRWVGIEGEYLFLSNDEFAFAQSSTGTPILARPFTNAVTGFQDSELVAFPNVVAGTVTAGAESSFNSAGARFRINACCHNDPTANCSQCMPCFSPSNVRFDWLAGYRYLRLDENIFIREQLDASRNNIVTTFDLRDQFDAQNTFHGGELGMLLELSRGPLFLELIGKAALGNTHHEMKITGSTTSVANGVTVTDPGGLLALSSNIGNYEQDKFSVVPEFSALVGYQLTYRLRMTFGYTFIHWSNVIRAGDQIDTTVNPNLLPPALDDPGPLRPAFAFRETDFWAQGMNFGLDYRW